MTPTALRRRGASGRTGDCRPAAAVERRLPGGEVVVVRPLRSGDAEALKAFHVGLSARTVYQRFLSAKPRLSRTDVAHLTELDGCCRLALVALDAGGEMVAVGRYMAPVSGGRVAELAFVVTDAWQRRGLCTVLFDELRRAAVEHGLIAFTATVLRSNTGMLAALDSFGLPYTRRDNGTVAEIRMPLPDPISATG